ncbi:MAG: hypothetical protein ACUVUE_07255 [Candidatus Bathycorpusculaceae bacterium]
MQGGIINEIVQNLRSKNRVRVKRGVQKISTLVEARMGEERFIRKLLKKLLRLFGDGDWQTRCAAMLGLREIAYTGFVRKKIRRIIPVICRGISDEDGRVRWVSVQTLDWFRPALPDELYVGTYVKLMDMYEHHTGRTQRSIRQALDKMDSPHLRMLLRAMEYADTGILPDEVAQELAMEELTKGFEGWIEEMKERDLTRRMRMRSMPISPDASLEETVSRYNKHALDGVAKTLELPSPVTGLKKGELIEKICIHLRDPELLEGTVRGLRPNERFALLDLMLKGGLMLWDEFSRKYGDDLGESIYWNWHPPKSIMGRLKARGLIAEGAFNGKEWVLIPRDLKPLLQKIQGQS